MHAGHGLRLGYYAQEHETLDVDRTVLEHMRAAAAEQTDTDLRKILGAFLFSGDDVDKPAGVLSGGEKTRLALATLVCSGANVLLLDEPTNNLDPVSREQVLDAIARYPGAIVLVTHDPGAVHGAQAGPGDPAARRRRGRLERRPARTGRAGLTALPPPMPRHARRRPDPVGRSHPGARVRSDQRPWPSRLGRCRGGSSSWICYQGVARTASTTTAATPPCRHHGSGGGAGAGQATGATGATGRTRQSGAGASGDAVGRHARPSPGSPRRSGPAQVGAAVIRIMPVVPAQAGAEVVGGGGDQDR